MIFSGKGIGIKPAQGETNTAKDLIIKVPPNAEAEPAPIVLARKNSNEVKPITEHVPNEPSRKIERNDIFERVIGR